jgi:hypothetical protein
MNGSKQRGFWLLLILLLIILGRAGYVYSKYGPGSNRRPFVAVTVTITQCTATPDPVPVFLTDTLTWVNGSGDNHVYTIGFPTTTPIGSASSPTSKAQPVVGDIPCDTNGPVKPALCYFKYNISQDGIQPPCKDPGVRVIPTTRSGFGYWLKLFFGVGD